MVKIRLSRTGRKHEVSFRIVATPQREKRESDVLEYLGHYSPQTKEVKVNKERVEYWLSVGAQPTEVVRNLLIKEKILPKPQHKKKYEKNPGRKKQERTEKAAAEAEAKKEEKKKEE